MNRSWISTQCFLWTSSLAWALAPSVWAVDFEKDIEPILRTNCVDCHGEDEQNGQLRLDQLAPMLSGGNSGEPAVVPGKPEASYLLKLIRHEEPGLSMPPDDALSAEEIALIEAWISAGAETPERYGPATVKPELSHWAFQPLERPTSSKDIDGFIRERLSEQGLVPGPRAQRRQLIRRLFLVVLGMPPTPEQVDTFLSDPSPTAWNDLVERVLASPHYGEHFASLWLDLVRFGETNGFETNRERPTAWPYRDWVIASFNEDKAYDDFVQQQIAGDVFGEPIGTGFLVAGPVDIVKGQDEKLRQMQRMNELDDMINATGTAFLALTTGCARCHNHKFDPISQKDYYSMQAVFAGVEHADGSLPLTERQQQELAEMDAEIEQQKKTLSKFLATPDLRPAVNASLNVEEFQPREVTFIRFTIEQTNSGEPCIDELVVYSGNKNVALAANGALATSSGDFKHPLHKLEHINDGQFGNARSWIAEQANGGWVQIELPEPIAISRIEWARDREGKFSDRLATEYRIESSMDGESWELLASSADRQTIGEPQPTYVFDGHAEPVAKTGRAALKKLEELESQKKLFLTESSTAWIGNFSQPGPTYRLYRGEPDAPREPVGPDAITAFTSLDLPTDAPEKERRAAFAEWVASASNPLTARVMANRVWQFHFGEGIVDTPSDFGKNGTQPTHPALLDWLACELIDSGWSLKHLHRLILNSHAWQQSTQPDAAALRVDADTRLLWRFPPRRLGAEEIRDSILAVSGVLDLSRIGGPGFSAFEVEMENVRHYHAKQEYGPEDWRRMIYMTKVRQEREHVFGAFDCPDASMVVPQRNRSTTPIQALNLLNSRFVMQQAELFASRLERERGSDEERIELAWQLCFARPPTSEESADSRKFIQEYGRIQFARALLNANELLFIP